MVATIDFGYRSMTTHLFPNICVEMRGSNSAKIVFETQHVPRLTHSAIFHFLH